MCLNYLLFNQVAATTEAEEVLLTDGNLESVASILSLFKSFKFVAIRSQETLTFLCNTLKLAVKN